MMEETAHKVANVVMGAVALGAVIYVLKTPPLRRIAWRFTVAALTGTAPAWFRSELQRAWIESGRESTGIAVA